MPVFSEFGVIVRYDEQFEIKSNCDLLKRWGGVYQSEQIEIKLKKTVPFISAVKLKITGQKCLVTEYLTFDYSKL